MTLEAVFRLPPCSQNRDVVDIFRLNGRQGGSTGANCRRTEPIHRESEEAAVVV